jgi:lipoprotein-anchoring transpeptidase ErfK/SrfK
MHEQKEMEEKLNEEKKKETKFMVMEPNGKGSMNEQDAQPIQTPKTIAKAEKRRAKKKGKKRKGMGMHPNNPTDEIGEGLVHMC